MKKIVSLITALSLLLSSTGFAHVGGPFSSDNFITNNTATFQVFMFFRNGMGQARFADQQSSIFAFPGLSDQSVWYHRGITYFGRAFGAVDYQTKNVTCITQNDSNSVNLRLGNADDAPALTSNDANNPPTSPGYAGRPALLDSFSKLHFTKEFPNIQFEGDGRAHVTIPQLDIDTIQELIAISPQTSVLDYLDPTLVPLKFDEYDFKIWGYGAQISQVGKNQFILGNVLTQGGN